MLRNTWKLIALTLLMAGFAANGWGYYFQDGFANANSWNTNLKYGFDTGISLENGNHIQTFNAPGLIQNGYVSTATLTLDFFKGIMVQYTNVTFTASPEQPFGYELTRTGIRLDPDNEAIVNGQADNQESGRMWGVASYWLVQQTTSVTNLNAGAKFNAFMNFMEFYRPKLASEDDNRPLSYWGVNNNKVGGFDLSALTRPGGGTTNLENLLRWTYDDRWGKNTTGGGGTDHTAFTTNSNIIKIRVTTDGATAYLYINPNPTGSATQRTNAGTVNVQFPNEFILIGQAPITFTNGIQPMFGIEANRVDGEMYYQAVTNFTIRSICSNVVSEVAPGGFKAGTVNTPLYGVIKPLFSTNDEAGVSEIYIDLPPEYKTGFSNWNHFTNQLSIQWITNGTNWLTFARAAGDVEPAINTVALSITNDGNRLKVRFRAASDADNNVFHPDKIGTLAAFNAVNPAILFVISNFAVSGNADSSGTNTFTISVNNERYAGNLWSRVATTGRMRSLAGNAYNMALIKAGLPDQDLLSIRTYNNQAAVSTIRPTLIYEGMPSTFYYDVSTRNATNNNASVTEVRFDVPAGFTIDGNSFRSYKLTNTASFKVQGGQVVVSYTNEGAEIPSGGGIDTIIFSVTETPLLGATNQTNVTWPGYVSNSTVPGMVLSNITHDTEYPLPAVVIRKKPPAGEAAILPAQVSNTLVSNVYQFVIKNTADAVGNNIEYAIITIDPLITNITDVVSARPMDWVYEKGQRLYVGTNITGTVTNIVTNTYSNCIVVNYRSAGTNIPRGDNDVITFTGYDEVASLSAVTLGINNAAYVDNGNGDAVLKKLSTAPQGLTLTFYTPPASMTAAVAIPRNENNVADGTHIMYADVQFATNMRLWVSNAGEPENDISWVRIFCPDSFTNIGSVTAFGVVTKYPGVFTNISTNIAGSITNFITNTYSNAYLVDYTGYPLAPGEVDNINFLNVMDNINSPATVEFKLEARNTTNYAPVSAKLFDTLSIQYIWEPVRARSFITVDSADGTIDASTNRYRVSLRMSNTGLHENRIYSTTLSFTNLITNVVPVSSLLGGSMNAGANSLQVSYDTLSNFRGGSNDVITFELLWDNLSVNEAVFPVLQSVVNARNVTNNITDPTGSNRTVRIVPPNTLYAAALMPQVAFTVTNAGQTNTNTLTLVVSNRGWGGNRLARVRVDVPPLFAGKILEVSNTSQGWVTGGADPLLISNGNYIWLDYQAGGTNLLAQTADSLVITYLLATNLVTNLSWDVRAMNFTTNELVYSNISITGMTNRLWLTEQPRSSITPNEVLSPSVSNYFSINIRNGNSPNNRTVKKVRVGLQQIALFTNIVNVESTGGSAVRTTYLENGTNFAEVEYLTGLTGTADEFVRFWAYDEWNVGANSTTALVQVDYNDGAGWVSTAPAAGGSWTVGFVNPVVSARTYVTPNALPQDYPGTNYQFFIQNAGEVGNSIMMVKIALPAAVTNVSAVASAPIALDSWTNSNNVIIVYYTNNVIGGGETNMITLSVLDNVEDPGTYSGAWAVTADNTPDNSGELAAVVISGRSLGYAIVKPEYESSYYVEAAEPMFTTEPTWVDATKTANTLRFYLDNTSRTNDIGIVSFRIRIPDTNNTVINLASLTVSNTAIAGAVCSVSNGFIVVDYSASPVMPYDSLDVIYVHYNDAVDHFETNITWTAEAAYNATYNLYKPATVFSGRSSQVRYVMPPASAAASVSPGETYFTRPEILLNVKISNTGSGSSDIDRAFVFLPVELTNGFTAGAVSNTFATNWTVTATNGGMLLSLYYDYTFNPGDMDSVWLAVSNSAAVSAALELDVSVRNTINLNAAAGDKEIFLSSVPVYSITPNQFNTTTAVNHLKVYIRNTINGGAPIKRVRLLFPAAFTNRANLQSTVLTNLGLSVSGTVNDMVLDYEAEGSAINSGDYDVIEMDLYDNYETGNMTNAVTGFVDAGQGYVPLWLEGGKSSNLAFVMPEANAFSTLEPEYIVLTTVTDRLELAVSNRGTGTSRLAFVRVTLPAALAEISNITSLAGGDILLTNISGLDTILVAYTNTGLINPGGVEKIAFDFSNRLSQVTNLNILVEAANLTNEPMFAVSPSQSGLYTVLALNHPPVGAEGYFAGDHRLYLIETNAQLTYRVLNRSYGTQITNLTVTFDTNVWGTVLVSNTSGKPVSFGIDTNGGQVVMTAAYPDSGPSGTNFGYLMSDEFVFTFYYALSNTRDIKVTGRYWTMGDTNVEALPTYTVGLNRDFVSVTNADWGGIKGIVNPVFRPANVLVCLPGTYVPAQDANSNALSAVTRTGTGEYLIKRIPAGAYWVHYAESYYRTNTVEVTVTANVITELTNVMMRNAPLMSGNTNQLVLSYDNTNTRIDFPANAVNREFSVNIRNVDLTAEQKADVATNSLVRAPVNTDGLKGWIFELNDFADSSIEGSVLELDATLTVAYDLADIQARGWSENDLALYYWDNNGLIGRFVRVGGALDTVNKTITARVSYVHTFYAVLARSAVEEGVIRSVAVRPRVFTPSRSMDGYYGSVRISFEIDPALAPEGFEVRIYDVRGMLVKTFKRTGAYTQGEVAWDARDDEGFPVKSGVYIYRVVAGGQVYAGTVVIAR